MARRTKTTKPSSKPTATLCPRCGYSWLRRPGALPRAQCPSCHKNIELAKPLCRGGLPHRVSDRVVEQTGEIGADPGGIWLDLTAGKSLVMACDRCDAPVRVSLQIVPALTTPALALAR
jgi:hypothetical protein